MKNNNIKKLIFFLLLTLAMVFWGAAWVSGKIISGMANANVIVFWRFVMAFIALIPVVLLQKQNLIIDYRKLFVIMLAAIFYIAYNQLFFKGLARGLAGAGGVLVTTTNPVFTHMLVLIFFKQKISANSIIGLCLGVIGGIILLKIWTFSPDQIFRHGNLYFLVASITWAFLSITSQKGQMSVTYLVYNFYLYLFASVFQSFFILSSDVFQVFSLGTDFWLNLIYLSGIAMAFSSTIFIIATNYLGSHKASGFVFIIPFTAVFFSFIFLKEKPAWYTIIGGILAVIAVYFINMRKTPAKKLDT